MGFIRHFLGLGEGNKRGAIIRKRPVKKSARKVTGISLWKQAVTDLKLNQPTEIVWEKRAKVSSSAIPDGKKSKIIQRQPITQKQADVVDKVTNGKKLTNKEYSVLRKLFLSSSNYQIVLHFSSFNWAQKQLIIKMINKLKPKGTRKFNF